MLILSTAGCSGKGSSNWISSDGTNILINGEPAFIDEFDGHTGRYGSDGSKTISVIYGTCDLEFRNCKNNPLEVYEDDLTKFKKATYFMGYMDSYSVMHMPNDETSTKEAIISTSDSSSVPINSSLERIYNTLSGLKYGDIHQAAFTDRVNVTTTAEPIKVKKDSVVIPGVLAITKGNKNCTQQVEISGVTVMKYESTNYDFYQLDDILIKASKGIDVSQYITFNNVSE